MPKVSQQYLEARRAEILDAAVVCFARQGFYKATMQDIVRESGLSPGAIYNLFDGKEEIIEAIALRRHSQEQQVMAEAMQKISPLDALKEIGEVFFRELTEPREQLRRQLSVQLWAEAQRNKRILKMVRRSFEEPHQQLKAILIDAQERGEILEDIDSDALARFVIAAFYGLVLQTEWKKGFSVEPQLKILNLLLKAVSAPASGK